MQENASLASSLASLPEDQRKALLDELSDEEVAALDEDWRFWARPDQLAPDWDWFIWIALAGRGWGKTRTGASWVNEQAEAFPRSRGALVAETAADCRDVLVEGESGIIASARTAFKPVYEPSKRRLTWPNGTIATLYNATEPDQLRGPQHHWGWCDELAKWDKAQETFDQLQFGLRLGARPRCMITTTPRPIPLIKALIKRDDVEVTRGRTMDNAGNLAASFISEIHNRYAGTRLGRQELEAEILDDLPGAFWTREMFDRSRVRQMPELRRVVVAVDPSGARSAQDADSDSQGIVVAGIGVDGRGYVLADRSCKLSADGWARRAVAAYHEFGADRLVAERNYGGDMIRSLIATVDKNVAYKEVVASRGKVLRAEPVAALYEQGRVSHCGSFPELEDQMCQIDASGYVGEGSPDRADALVWALTELMLDGSTYTLANIG